MSIYVFNKYTDLSLNVPSYLDKIKGVYTPSKKLPINKKQIIRSYNRFQSKVSSNPLEALSDLIQSSVDEDCRSVFFESAIEHSHVVESLKSGRDIIDVLVENTNTATALLQEVQELSFDVFYDRLSVQRPSRRLGSAAQHHIKHMMKKVTTKADVLLDKKTYGPVFLSGSDANRTDFAKKYFKFDSVSNKGLDLVARVNTNFVCGEVKYVTRQGGSQNNQIKSAMDHLCATTSSSHKVKKIAVIDGWPFFSQESMEKIYSDYNLHDDSFVMSILILPTFLDDLGKGKV